MRKKVKFTLLILPVPLALVVVAIYCSLVYVPGWYAPQHVTADQQQTLRDELTELTRVFNNGMQRPVPFEFVISERIANRLIDGLGLIDPNLADVIPEQIIDPAAAWRDDKIRFGCIVQADGKKLLANVSIELGISDDKRMLLVDDIAVRVGAWPVPFSYVEEYLNKAADRSSKLDREVINRLIIDRAVENRFKYPNSDYDFRIDKIVAEDGNLALTIHPIEHR